MLTSASTAHCTAPFFPPITATLHLHQIASHLRCCTTGRRTGEKILPSSRSLHPSAAARCRSACVFELDWIGSRSWTIQNFMVATSGTLEWGHNWEGAGHLGARQGCRRQQLASSCSTSPPLTG